MFGLTSNEVRLKELRTEKADLELRNLDLTQEVLDLRSTIGRRDVALGKIQERISENAADITGLEGEVDLWVA